MPKCEFKGRDTEYKFKILKIHKNDNQNKKVYLNNKNCPNKKIYPNKIKIILQILKERLGLF